MKRIKKILASLMVAVMVLTAAPLSGFVGLELNLDWLSFDWLDFNTKASAASYSGTCGDNLTWLLDTSTGELVISDEGEMDDYSSYSPVPWHSYRSSIKKVTIGDSVTSIGSCAFKDCANLTSITIPDGVTTIGYSAFYGCTSLTRITIPDSVTSIGNDAFFNTGYYNNSSNWEKNVLYIGNHLIKANTNLSGAYTIKEGTKSIAGSAFYNCKSLTSITIPDSVTSIGSSTFYGCMNLTSITIPDSVTSIGDSAFSYCDSLTSITIPDSVTSIDFYAFIGCTSLTSIIIPDSVTSIGYSAFYNTGYYNNSSNWEKNVLYIGNYLIKANTNLSGAYTIKVGTKCIADEAFYNCESLINITIPNSVTSIGGWAFYGCTSLTSITIPDSVTSIGGWAFYGCTSLTRITIPDSVIGIGSCAFYGCTSLTSITIPDSVTSIGNYAFYNCTSLTDVYYKGTQEQWNSITIGSSNDPLTSATIHFIQTGTCGENLTWTFDDETGELVISGTGEMKDYSYSSYVPWYSYRLSIKKVTIGDGVTSIGSYAFLYCDSLTSITIPDSVTSIGSSAFYGCTRLTSITIPDSVTSIGSSAFYNCKSLTSITISDSVTSIGSSAFYNCTSLTDVYYTGTVTEWCAITFTNTNSNPMCFAKNLYINGTLVKGDLVIPDSVTSIGSYAFYNCTSLTSVTIPDGVASIGYSVFEGCTSLTSIAIPDSVASIGYSVFEGCTSLTSITIPDGVTSISSFAFSGCKSLTSITIPDSVTSIGSYAFSGCTGLTSITIPDSVTSIGDSAFYNTGYYNDSSNWEGDVLYIGNHLIKAETSISGAYTVKEGTKCIADNAFFECGSLTSITIPDGVTSIYKYTFYECDSLTSITIPDGVTSIGESVFDSCDSLTSITIPDSVTSIGYYAFYGCTSLTSITIPDSVTSIGKDAFKDTGYYYNSSNWEDDVLYIGNHLIEANRSISGAYTIKEGTKCIAASAFSDEYCGCDSLTSIIIPDSVTSIGYSAFSYCTSLTSITIPDSVTSIGDSAFYNTGYYNDSSNWEDGVLYIGNHLIEANTSISDAYTIKEGTKSIAGFAFYNCTSLTSITIHDSVTSIGYSAFNGCASLTDVYYFGTQTQWNSIAKGSDNEPLTKADIHFCEKREGVSATCEVDGYTEGVYCSVCDKYVLGHEEIPALGHDYHETVEQSSCTVSGLKYKKCSRCESVIDRETVPALGHNPEYFKVDPTCKEAGYECYKCTNCGTEYMREELDIIDHIAGDWETVETATCSEDGYKIKKCTMCGEETHRETIPATGHSYGESIVTEPTCEGVGTKRFTCSVCGDSYDEEVEANGHKVKVIRKEPTCTSLGNEQSLCEVCGNMIGEMTFIPKLPHNYTEKVIAEPTCVKDGTKRYTCSSCGDSYDETLPATGEHKINIIRKEPTCTSVGNEQYLCETCGNMIGDMVFLPKLPHTYGEWTVVKDPTATEEGSKEHSCTACGKTETVAIPAIGFETADGVTVDLEKNIISGFNAGVSSLDSYTTTVNENYVWEYEAANGKLGTGSKAILKDGDTVIGEYTILVYGDTTGDSWYDGQDAVLVSCLANGMLTKDDVSEAVYMAADCNHDGVIDQLDVDLLNQAGVLLTNVDQSKPTEVLLETSAEYVEYLDLIDQSPEIEAEDDTDTPEVDIETEETPEADTEDSTQQDAKVDIFEMILNFIKSIFEMLLSYIPMPIK